MKISVKPELEYRNVFLYSSIKDNMWQISLVFILVLSIIGGPFAIDDKMLNTTADGQLFFYLYTALIISFLIALNLYAKKSFEYNISLIDVLFTAIIILLILDDEIVYSNLINTTRIEILVYFIFYIAFRLVKDNYINLLFTALLVAGICQAIFGNLQLYGFFNSYNGDFKMTGTFFNPGPFAGYLIIIFPIAVGFFLFKKNLFFNVKNKFLYEIISTIALLTILLVIPSSDSRAAWFAGIISILYLLFIASSFPKFVKPLISRFKVLFYSTLAVILLVTSIFFYNHKQQSSNGRILIWKIGSTMFLNKPILGCGTGKFKAEYMNYQADFFHWKRSSSEILLSDNVQYPFNEALHIAIELGIAGLLLFCSLAFYVFRLQSKNPENNSLVNLSRAGLLSLVAFSMFSYPSEIMPINLVGVFYLTVVSRYTKGIYKLYFPLQNKYYKLFLLPLVIFYTVFFAVTWNWIDKNKTSFYDWKYANNYYSSGFVRSSLLWYKDAYLNLKDNGLFLNNYGKALSTNADYQQSIDVLNCSEQYLSDSYTYLSLGDDYQGLNENNVAEACYIKAIDMVPSEFYPKYCLIKLYIKSGQINKAVGLSKDFFSMKVKIDSKAISQMKDEINKLLKSK
jgi:O-antigen polymerase